MNIYMVSSEAEPFAKSGGLADAVSALSKSLFARGHDVRIVIPLYDCVPKADLQKLCTLSVETGYGIENADVWQSFLPSSDIPVFFIDKPDLFARQGIYGSRYEPDYKDNPRRYSFFCRAAFRLCGYMRWIPDVFHAHDWPTSFVPVFLKYSEPGFENSKSVLTIHNLGYQGVYSKEYYESFRMPWDLYYSSGFEYYDSINILKAGLTCADKLTTVSPTYAREIQTQENGWSMDGLLRSRSADLVGILNGVDTSIWDPKDDEYIPCRYSLRNISGKGKCKEVLQFDFGLNVESDKPLIGMVSRLTDQKGIKELFDPEYGCIAKICEEMDVQFVVQGSGEPWCESILSEMSAKYQNFKVNIGYSERLAHLIEAGSDFFLMPSHYEPCGLNQMYSLRYGTLPIAHRTGGLADTISNYNQEIGSGTGFLFDGMSSKAIYDTIGWAVWAYYNKRIHIEEMRLRGMSQSFSWDKSALEYERLYLSL